MVYTIGIDRHIDMRSNETLAMAQEDLSWIRLTFIQELDADLIITIDISFYFHALAMVLADRRHRVKRLQRKGISRHL